MLSPPRTARRPSFPAAIDGLSSRCRASFRSSLRKTTRQGSSSRSLRCRRKCPPARASYSPGRCFMAAAAARPAPRQRENMLVNLLFNIAAPGLILSKLSADDRLGPVGALLLGISIPLSYGLYDLVARRKWNLFSIVGLCSVSLTGGFALLQ